MLKWDFIALSRSPQLKRGESTHGWYAGLEDISEKAQKPEIFETLVELSKHPSHIGIGENPATFVLSLSLPDPVVENLSLSLHHCRAQFHRASLLSRIQWCYE